MMADGSERAARLAVVRQSRSGLAAHIVLFAVVAGTTPILRARPALLGAVSLALLVLVAFRFAVATTYVRASDERRAELLRLFRAGVVASATFWGVGGAALIVACEFQHQSWLILMTIAGITAGGVTSLAGDLSSVRAHTLLMLLPMFVTAAFMPDGASVTVGRQ